jgi:hypothetical protein
MQQFVYPHGEGSEREVVRDGIDRAIIIVELEQH